MEQEREGEPPRDGWAARKSGRTETGHRERAGERVENEVGVR